MINFKLRNQTVATSSKDKLIRLCSHTFPKKKQTFNFMRDSGNEFHTLSDAYKHMVIVLKHLLAKIKLVTF